MKRMTAGRTFTVGVAMAPAFCYMPVDLTPDADAPGDPQEELSRFRRAVEQVSQEFEALSARHDVAAAHLEFVQDPALEECVRQRILKENKNAQMALHETAQEFRLLFGQMEDDYMRAREADVKDVEQRLMQALKGVRLEPFSQIREKVILIARDLMPSDTAQMDLNYIAGFITQEGGPTSHVAIMARSLGIPALVGVEGLLSAVEEGELVALDAGSGEIVIDPDQPTQAEFQVRRERFLQEKEALEKMAALPSVSADGRTVRLCANVGSLRDIEAAQGSGMDGVGLFRTEFLLMDRDSLPSEEEQFEVYRSAAQMLKGKELIVRTFDIGGDKPIPYLAIEPESNPFLGYRAIRMCLDRQGIFRTQLRALLRASAYGNISIMYPMIVSLDELTQANRLVQACRMELRQEGKPVGESVRVGMMIETPASVVMAEEFAAHVDFFSIGTNDLTQYVLAADRGNKKVSALYDPFDPAVLRSISRVIDAGHRANIPVGMCGELAGNPQAFELLLGMGLDEFSMSAGSIPGIKAQLRQSRCDDAGEVARRLLACGARSQVRELLETGRQAQ